jgi:rhodanese-related sulfurtransferase
MSDWFFAHYVQEIPGWDGVWPRLGREDPPPAIAVDLRAPGDYAAGHVAGARNLSAAAIVADPGGSLADLDPVEDEVILYDAAAPDPDVWKAAFALEAAGFLRVCVYAGGFADWQANGGATE